MSEAAPKTLDCPTCGAPLEPESDPPLVRCGSCGGITLLDAAGGPTGLPDGITELVRAGNKVEAIKEYRERYEVSLERAKQAVDLIEAGQRQETESRPRVRDETAETQPVQEVKAAASPARWLGLAIPLTILAVVLGILAFALLQPDSPLMPRLEAHSPAILLDSEAGALPDVVLPLTDTPSENKLIGRFDGATGRLEWTTKPLPEGSPVDAVLSDGGLVFVASREALFAYDSDNGKLAWQVEMPGKLDLGENTILARDGYVLALTVDRSLQAYDTQSGELAWRKQLRGFFRGLWLFGDALAYVDYTNESNDYSLIFFDPVDGGQERVITPLCQTGQPRVEKLESDSGIAYDEAENSLYLVFGLLQGCVQRYDLDNGEMIWQAVAEDEGFLLSNYGFNAVMGETTFYFSYENRLFAVEKQTGSLRVVLASYNYALAPLSASGDTLVAMVRRIHGPEGFEIWGLDAATGRSRWQVSPANARPIDAPFRVVSTIGAGEAAWTSRITPDALVLLKFQAAPNGITIETIDTLDGSGSGQKTVALTEITADSYAAPEVIGWQGDVVYFILETRLYGLDVATGELVLQY
ncbi:MAG: PQQ-binding-like beta-propeller repeat protein [Chloroflexota bacterium]